MKDKIIRVELFVDNKQRGYIQLPTTKDFIFIIKDWLDRQAIQENAISTNSAPNSQQPLKSSNKEFNTSYGGERGLSKSAIKNGEMEGSPALDKHNPADNIHSQIKKELDKDYAKDKLNAQRGNNGN